MHTMSKVNSLYKIQALIKSNGKTCSKIMSPNLISALI